MPTYEYVCQDCGHMFTVQASIAEYSKGLRPKCPQCGSTKVVRSFCAVQIMSSKGGSSPQWRGCGPSAGPGCCG